MDGVYTQDNNLGWIETALGKDHLLLERFEGTDRVNGLFEYKAQVLGRNGLDYDALLGTHATVQLGTAAQDTAPFDGIVTEVEWLRGDFEGDHFLLTLRPWLWLAGRRRQQRIFHEKKVNEILDEVLKDWSSAGPSTFRMDLSQAYPELEYTVQYGESDFAFACRMMERFGISYHFEHEAGNHCMVLTDAHESMGELPGLSREYRPIGEFYRKDEEHFWEWREARGVTTGKVKLADYNFKKPGAKQVVEQLGDAEFAFGDIESYDYPTGIEDTGTPGAAREPSRTASEGEDDAARKALVQLRTTQERSADFRTHAAGDVISLKSGMRCVARGPDAEFLGGAQHLCLEAHHDFTAKAYHSGGEEEDRAYKGRYVMTPVSAPFAPARTTPRPVMQGPQTARVVGEGEIDCDKYGRILVRFHWDLEDSYSMRCRVSQNWAGKGWGGMVIPRIGMEVVVEFLDGDPDKPLVTGCVYNGKNDVPYELPANKTRSTFKTDTHQGDGFNELRFEDERHEEEVFLRAQKDLSVKVAHNEARIVDADRASFIKSNDVSVIGSASYMETNGSRTDYVGPPSHSKYTVKQSFKVFDMLQDWARGASALASSGGRWSMTTIVHGVRSTLIKNRETKTIEEGYDKNVGGKYDISAGDFEVTSKDNAKLEGARHVSIHAGDSLTLSCGAARIQMQSDGSLRLYGVRVDVVGSKTVDIDGTSNVRIDTSASKVDLSLAGVDIVGKKINLN